MKKHYLESGKETFMYSTLSDIISTIYSSFDEETENVNITGSSSQSCSVYLDVNGMSVRISNHDSGASQISVCDYFLAIDVDNKVIGANDYLEVTKVFCYLDIDENEKVIEVECAEHEHDDAELIGYRVSRGEIDRVIGNIIFASKNKSNLI